MAATGTNVTSGLGVTVDATITTVVDFPSLIVCTVWTPSPTGTNVTTGLFPSTNTVFTTPLPSVVLTVLTPPSLFPNPPTTGTGVAWVDAATGDCTKCSVVATPFASVVETVSTGPLYVFVNELSTATNVTSGCPPALEVTGGGFPPVTVTSPVAAPAVFCVGGGASPTLGAYCDTGRNCGNRPGPGRDHEPGWLLTGWIVDPSVGVITGAGGTEEGGESSTLEA